MSAGTDYENMMTGGAGMYQHNLVNDQKAALQSGYNWSPQGWQEKTDPNAPPVGSVAWSEQQKMLQKMGPASGSQTPTMIDANYQQQSFDPWSKYRGAAGDMLASGMDPSNDPSNIYRDRLESMISGGGGDFTTSDPSYQFRFEQGQIANERSLAAKGLLNSGNAAAELQQYGQKAASQEYGAQFERLLQGMQGTSQQYDTQQQRLMQMAGINLDPTSAAKLNLQAEGINTDRMNTTNQYNLGMINAANDRYATDTNAQTTRGSSSYRNSGGGGGIDTESLFAGKASRDVYSANWWADQESGNGSSMSSY